MAERRYKSANIATQTDTFGAWVDRTNQLVFDLSEIIVTAQQNTTGGATSVMLLSLQMFIMKIHKPG